MSRPLLRAMLGQVAVPEPGAEVSDPQLLDRFAQARDEAAFAQLVRRHGGMVLGVCRRLLGDAHAADDAFQATFLALASRPRAVRKQASLASWLHRVAYRVARRAGYQAGRRRAVERAAPVRTANDPLSEMSWREVREVLDTELQRLPERFRAPLVLCYLEGKTRDEAAQLLGWTTGTVKGRLERGRQMLERRLVRRGITLSAGLLASLLTQNTSAAVPSVLAAKAAEMAMSIAGGNVAISAPATTMANAVLRELSLRHLRFVATMFLVGCLVAAAGAFFFSRIAPDRQGEEPQRPPAVIAPPAQAAEGRKDRAGDPLPPHAIARLGSQRFRHGAVISKVAASPDGRFLAGAGGVTNIDSTVSVWDANSGRTLFHLRFYAEALDFSPDSKALALFDQFGGKLQVIDVATGKVLHEFDRRDPALPRRPVLGSYLAFLPGGKQLVLRDSREPIARVLDAGTGAEIRAFRLGDQQYTSTALSPDGEALAVGEKSGTVRLWTVATGVERFALQKHTGDCTALAFAPDSKTLATGGKDSHVHLWNPTTGELVRTLAGPQEAPYPVVEISYAPDGRSLVVSHSLLAVVWDPVSGKELRRLRQEPSARLRFLSDGKTLLVGPPAGRSNVLRFLDATTGERVRQSDGHEGNVMAVAWSADGKRLATAGSQGPILVWDTTSGKVVFKDQPQNAGIGILAFSPKGDLLAAASAPTSVALWDIKAGKQLPGLSGTQPGPGAFPLALAFAPDGSKLAAGNRDGMVRVWDMGTSKEVLAFRVENTSEAIAFSSNFELAASGDSRTDTIHLWDLATGKELRKIQRGNQGFINLTFSADSQTLLEAGGRGQLLLWEVATGKQIRSVPQEPRLPVRCIAWSSDGRLVALAGLRQPVPGPALQPAGENPTLVPIQLYDIPGNRFLPLLAGHEGAIFALSFSPDGRTLASASADTTVLLWDVSGLKAPDGKGGPE